MPQADEAPNVADPTLTRPPASSGEAAAEGRGSFVFPPGSRIVHIGPHKTGTTSLQAALHAARPALSRQGVHYAGRDSKSADAVRAVRGVAAPSGRMPAMRQWHDLAREARSAGAARWLLSNEFLADASPQAIRTIARDLEPERVHVVATLRPLARILTSQWQQYVQGGLATPFERWLRETLAAPVSERPTGFWRRHRHDQLLRRWADVVGSARVTAVIVGEAPAKLLSQFERLLGLAAGTLALDEDPRNRSMTLAEIEAVRTTNLAFEAAGLPSSLHYRFVQRGAAEQIKLRRPDPDEPRVALAAWALEEVAAHANAIVDAIEGSGVRVVGDLGALRAVPQGEAPAGAADTAAADAAPPVPPGVADELARALDAARREAAKGARRAGAGGIAALTHGAARRGRSLLRAARRRIA